MKYIIFLIFIIAFQVVNASGGGFVGNGGEGVEIVDHLYVRDLFEANLHLQAYFGESQDPHFNSVGKIFGFADSETLNLLSRKLTDLNLASPGVGDFVWESMKLYSWDIVDLPLNPTHDDPIPVLFPRQMRTVQVATRLGMTIRIDRGQWQKLDRTNQVALLVHEGLYSLIRPRFSGVIGAQTPESVRKYTALFFNFPVFLKDPGDLYRDLSAVFTIPADFHSTQFLRQVPNWQICLAENTSGHGCFEEKVISVTDVDFSIPRTSPQLFQILRGVCEKAEALKNEHLERNFSVGDRYRNWPFYASIWQYRVSDDSDERQEYVYIEAEPPTLFGETYNFQNKIQNAEDCVRQFRMRIEDASSPRETWPSTHCRQCLPR